jgi:hypothetical protein
MGDVWGRAFFMHKYAPQTTFGLIARFPVKGYLIGLALLFSFIDSAWSQNLVGTFYQGDDGLHVRLNSLTVAETVSTYRYDISYTLENRTVDRAIDEGAFKAYFRNSSGGTPQYGFFGRLFPSNTLTRTYRWEELKTAPFGIIAYHSSQFFTQTPPSGSVLWPVTIPGLPPLPPPTIVSQPVSQLVESGSAVTFSVSASGTAALSYQWRKNGSPITAATAPTLTFGNAQLTDSGTYNVVVSDGVGSVTSASAVLTVTPVSPPSIATQPVSRSVNAGASVTVQVVVGLPRKNGH